MRNRKWKLAIAALLGFSTACSTVRQAPQQKPASQDETRPQPADTTQVKTRPVPPRIVLMYGVRPPLSDSVRIRRMERQQPDSLPPVAEEPREEDPAGK
ncbi:hypothetical protein [Alistipes sp.]|uniref:hypothetical protein n=1 Tax=Alistipes sp. TaxID=1872444 RepID=UPI003A8855EF